MIRRFFAGMCLLSLSGFSLLFAQDRVQSYGYSAIAKAHSEGRISLDQKVLYQLHAIRDPGKLPDNLRSAITLPVKCGTPLINEALRHQGKLSAAVQKAAQALAAPPVLENEQIYQSPEGKFQIHYTTSGDSAVSATDNSGSGIPDYVEWVAAAADSSWRHEVQTLGYTDPVTGPSSLYRIYILDLANYYGDTVQEGNTTFIRIENDFSEDFPPNDDPEGNQRGAVKVTVAHELKHAIQYVDTQWGGESGAWVEMDATLMEEVVYDNVNDYYNYLDTPESIFHNPQDSFYPGTYYHVTWALFFEEKYGSGFWVGVWDRLQAEPFLSYTEAMSRELGGDQFLHRDYIESQLWHFASGPEHSASAYGFEERMNYPDPSVDVNNNFYTTDFAIPRPISNTENLEGFSAVYYRLNPATGATGELIMEVLNRDEHAGTGLIAYFENGTTDTRIYPPSTISGEAPLKKPGWDWGDLNYIGLILTNSSTGSSSPSSSVRIGNDEFNMVNLSQNFPNPFRSETIIRFTLAQRTQVRINVYDITGRLVKTIIDEVMDSGLYEEPFTTSDLASGVYFYQLITNEESRIKKMMLIK